MGTLDGKVAIITGAGGGIGSATARVMSGEGARVVAADIAEDPIAAVTDTIRSLGGEAVKFVVDVSSPDSVAEMIAFTTSVFGGIDILHNNAAAGDLVGRDYDVVDVDLGIWEGILAVNLTGPMLGCKHAIPEMLKRGGGSIINTTSVAGLFAERDHVSYGVAKAGLVLLTKHVAVRYGKGGVRCNAIAPGIVVTERTRARRDQAWLEAMAFSHNSPRLGEPEDIARLAAFLGSDASMFINGAIIRADGALTAKLRGASDLGTDLG